MNHIKMFEDFSYSMVPSIEKSRTCCNPLELLDAFENYGGDILRMAAYKINDLGFDGAERSAEDSEEAMAVRMLRSCSSSTGVDAIGMLDLLEDMRFHIDDVREMLFVLAEQGEEDVLLMRGGRAFLNRLKSIMC